MLTLFLKALKCIQVSLDPALDASFSALSLSNINFLRSGVDKGEFEFRTFFRRKGACESHMFKNIFLQAFQATLGHGSLQTAMELGPNLFETWLGQSFLAVCC